MSAHHKSTSHHTSKAAASKEGPFVLWTADASGTALHRPADHSHPQQNPSEKEGRNIVFSRNPSGERALPQDLAVCHSIDRALYALNHFYRPGDPAGDAKFRSLYAKVFDLGRQALETRERQPSEVQKEIDRIEHDVLDDEWTRVEDAALHETADIVGGAASPRRGEPRGPYLLWTTDDAGKALNRPGDKSHPDQDRQHKDARNILFSINPAGRTAVPEDMEVCDRTDKILHAMRHLYRVGESAAESQFRFFYARVFGIARMTLEEGAFSAQTAKTQLDTIERDLIQDEGPRIKNDRIRQHVRYAAGLSLPVALTFVLLRQLPRSTDDLSRATTAWFGNLGIAATTVEKLMIVLLGCFLGVCLSYALRKAEFSSADDLITPETDLLSPLSRLGITAALAVLAVMLAVIGIGDISIGSQPQALRSVVTGGSDMLAFLVGVVCGIGEQFLPTRIMGTTTSLLGDTKEKAAAQKKG